MSDLEELAHLVAQNIGGLTTERGREAFNVAMEFSESMRKIQSLNGPIIDNPAMDSMWIGYLLAGSPILSIDAMLGLYRMKVNARIRREERARKLKRRQRRAAQRRYNRGMR